MKLLWRSGAIILLANGLPIMAMAQSSWYGQQAAGNWGSAGSAVAFQHLQSGPVSLDIPASWQSLPPMGNNLGFISAQGESFSLGKLDIFADQASMRTAARYAQMTGTATPVMLAYMQRMVAPPLTPEQIVAFLLPRMSGGAMQNVDILGGQHGGYTSATIDYEYLLLPQRDALWRANLPPVLQRLAQVPMRGEMRITLVPGIPVGAVRTWSFLYSGVSAPQLVFLRQAAVYARMFQSVKINNAAVRESVESEQQAVSSAIGALKSEQQQIQDFTDRYRRNSQQQIEQMQDWKRRRDNIYIDMAGGQTRVVDPSDPDYTGYVKWGSQPANSRPVHCPAKSNDPVFVDNTKPTPTGCTDLQVYH